MSLPLVDYEDDEDDNTQDSIPKETEVQAERKKIVRYISLSSLKDTDDQEDEEDNPKRRKFDTKNSLASLMPPPKNSILPKPLSTNTNIAQSNPIKTTTSSTSFGNLNTAKTSTSSLTKSTRPLTSPTAKFSNFAPLPVKTLSTTDIANSFQKKPSADTTTISSQTTPLPAMSSESVPEDQVEWYGAYPESNYYYPQPNGPIYEGYQTYPEVDYQEDYNEPKDFSKSKIRNIERQLLERKDDVGLKIIDVKQDELRKSNWTPEVAGAKDLSLAQLQSKYGCKPSSSQRRKHQITYLAFEAQQRELEFIEKKNQTKMTKAQVKLKYGW